MSDSRQQLLDQSLDLSHAMFSRAEEGEWIEVIELEKQRRHLLEQAFATREAVNERLASQIRELLDLDKVLMQMSLKVRDEVAGELGQFNRSRKASNAYRASAR